MPFYIQRQQIIIKEDSRFDLSMNLIICIVCFLTNLTQLPFFVSLNLSSPLSMAVWIGFIVVLLFKGLLRKKIAFSDSLIGLILFAVFFLIFGSACQFLTHNNYLQTSLSSAMYIAFFINLIGILSSGWFNDKTIKTIAVAYILSAAIVATDIFFEYLLGADLSSRKYAYLSKNSISQVIITAIIFIIVFKFSEKPDSALSHVISIAYIVLFLFLIYVLLLLRSRSTLLAIPFVFLFILWKRKMNRKAAVIITIGIIAVTLFFIIRPSAYETFLNNIVFAGRDSDNLEDVTSSRYSEWETFGARFAESPLWGFGSTYRESVILCALLERGILGGIPILLFAVRPLFYGIFHFDFSKKDVEAFILIAFTYILNGGFEQLAPFGPGVKCYMLWFLFGVMETRSLYKRKNKTDTKEE